MKEFPSKPATIAAAAGGRNRAAGLWAAAALAWLLWFAQTVQLLAQGTAFTYQGHLAENGTPAAGANISPGISMVTSPPT